MSSTDPNVAVSTGNMQSSIGNGFEANPTEMSNKRKRETDDDGDQEQKKVHIESGTPGIEALHRDVGPPYRLASTRKTPLFALIASWSSRISWKTFWLT